MNICLLHVVDKRKQSGGVEKVFLVLLENIARDENHNIAVALNKGYLFDKIASIYNNNEVQLFLLPDKNVLNIPSFYWKLIQITRNFKPDVIHSHHRFTSFLACKLPFRSFKLVHTFHVEQFNKTWAKSYGDHLTAVSNGCIKQNKKYDQFI